MRNITLPITISIVTTLLLAGCGRKDMAHSTDEKVKAIDVAYPMVDSITIHRSYPGYLSSNSTVNVVGRADGQILTKNFNDGDLVKKGQVLFTIESTTYHDQVKQAQGQLATAKSEYEYASKNYNAMKLALKENAVAEISVIQAESDMKQAAAAIKSAEAALQTARTNLNYCTVTAPISGHITSASLDVGSYVGGGVSPVTLATIYDDSSMSVVFSLEENQYDLLLSSLNGSNRHLYESIPLEFKEKLPHKYTAALNYTSPTVNASTGTIELKAKVNNDFGELRNGMYATVKLPYGTEPEAILIPDASIGTDQLGKYIYVVNDSDKVVYTPIKVGDLYRDSLRVVEEGLSKNMKYVTKALLTVRNGETVTPVLQKGK